MDGRCSSCRFWLLDPNHDYGWCELTTCEGDDSGDQNPHPETKAITVIFFPDDGGFYRASLSTDADFGCVQWSARDGDGR